MAGSGSTLPQAAQSGASTTYDEGGGVVRANQSGIRKWGGEGGGSGEPGDWHEPYESPIGDGMWALLAFVAGYAVFRTRRQSVKVLKS